jgi:hypothetical protein
MLDQHYITVIDKHLAGEEDHRLSYLT